MIIIIHSIKYQKINQYQVLHEENISESGDKMNSQHVDWDAQHSLTCPSLQVDFMCNEYGTDGCFTLHTVNKM